MNMVDFTSANHHPAIEELAEVLCTVTQQDAKPYFRTLAAYYIGIAASCMRAKVSSSAFGDIPVNSYVIALAPSGFGKGKSTGAMENRIMADFRNTFRDYVMPAQAEKNIARLANRFSAIRGTDAGTETEKLEKEMAACGEFPFVFDGGSESAIKQVRQMLLLSDCGALNLQIDEIGTNLEKIGTMEAMATYLELYDIGMIKAKLLKNTGDNKRNKEIEGQTPANMLLFGTPAKLLDSGALERKFYSMLETGYARRCLFAWADTSASMNLIDDVDVIWDRLTNPSNQAAVDKWSQHFASLADPAKLHWSITTSETVDKLLLSYQIDCNKRVSDLSEFDEVRRSEMTHRYFRVIKVAGSLAFIDESFSVTEAHVHAAIKIVEDSGKGFQKLLNREPAHAKLARFIAGSNREMTHAELFTELPFFKAAGKGERSDLLTMATAWGYRQHIIIKKTFMDSVELISGETLKETDLEAVSLSYSDDFAYGYESGVVEFKDLPELTQADGLHWSNHAFVDGHRCEDKTIPGFDLLVLDVDGEASLKTVHDLLEDFVYMTSTTKRHTPETNRFRLIIPMNYELKLNYDDFREFMRAVTEWLPFKVDEAAIDRCRKWQTYEHGTAHVHMDGQLFDVLPFVPRTKRDEDRQKEMKELGSLDNLERWFAQRIASGNRNNQMLKFALALVDTGMDYNEVSEKVFSFNNKLNDKLGDEEIRRTVMTTVAKRLSIA